MFSRSAQIISGLDSKSKFQMFTLFPGTMLLSLGGTPTWRLHTGLFKFVQNISIIFEDQKKCTDLKVS